jgi:DNA-binding SARP family transcriptional activator/predicted ATPase
MLQLRLLGTPDIVLDGVSLIESMSSKAQAILFYLAVTQQPHTRSALAGLLWGDGPEEAARADLRKALANLRQAIPDHVVTDRQTVTLHFDSKLWLDIAAFEKQLKSPSPTSEALHQAIELYRGDFLNGFYVLHAPDFEDWMLAEQARLRELVVNALLLLVKHHADRGERAEGIAAARRLLTLEPWREEAHRQLMLLLAQDGQRGAALAQFEICRQTLEKELAVEPGAETIALYERIRNDELSGGAEEPRSGEVTATLAPQLSPSTAQPLGSSAPVSNLPPQSTPFVGREPELADILRRLKDPACRLLTLVGPGGIGKTRLATETGRRLINGSVASKQFPHGVFFVALASVSSTAGIVAAIGQAAGFSFYSNVSPTQQLLDYLREKELLLILDNFEHLLSPPATESGEAVNLVSQILSVAPLVKILVTSREALNLHEAWFHPVGGMPFPENEPLPAGEAALSALESYDAVRLFMQSVRRAKVNFSLAAEQQAVVRICQLVEGMPLGLELAAAWLKVMPATKIVQEIERSFDILSTRLHNVPERHRSMRAIFEHSWQRLDEVERAVLQHLAVFRGSFSQEAVERVAEADLLSLATLIDKSLLRATAEGRYQMHELLRQFAAEKLAANPQQEAITRQKHSAYYLRFLRAREAQFVGQAQLAALNEISLEGDNVRTGWRWAVEQGYLAAIDQAMESLYNFFQIRCRYQEGQELFAEAHERLKAVPALAEHPEFEAILQRLAGRTGAFSYFLGNYGLAAQQLQSSLSAAKSESEQAFTRLLLGEVAMMQGHRPAAEAQLRQSLAIFKTLDDKNGMANALHKLAQICGSFGEYLEAKRLAQESFALSQTLGRPDWEANALDVLGWSTVCLGQYAESQAYYQDSLTLFEQIGHQLGVALAIGGLGSVAWAIGGAELVEAQQTMEKSLALCREIGHRHQISIRLWYLAQIANDAGQHQAAERYSQEGLKIARAVGSPIFASYNLCSLGEAAGGLGHHLAARAYLTEALAITAEAGQLPPLTMALLHLAKLTKRESDQVDDSDPAKQEQRARALEYALVASRHPACWHIFRQRANQLQAELAAKLPAELVAVAQKRGQAQTLEETAARILDAERSGK